MPEEERPSSPGAGRDASAVTPREAVLAKFQELLRIEAENARLRALLAERDARLAELLGPQGSQGSRAGSGGSSSSRSVPFVSPGFPVVRPGATAADASAGPYKVDFPASMASPTRPTWPYAGHGCGLPDFRRWLSSVGIDVAKFSSQSGIESKTLEDIHRQVLRGEAWFSVEDGRVVHHVEMVKVYLLAAVAGEEQCLIEQDRFDLANGKQRTVMLPLAKKMRPGEDWRDAVCRALHEQVGVSNEWQQRFLELEEESYFLAEDTEMSNDCPDLEVAMRMHEVNVRVRSAARNGKAASDGEEEAALDHIGLPSGRDFVMKEEGEDGRTMLHVWCWKSREYERNARLKAFGSYLVAHGVDISLFGADDSKRTLFQFYLEVKEKRTCSLRMIDDVGLQRVVRLVRIRMVAEVHKMKRLLTECDRVWDDGRQRQQSNKLIVKKMKEDDEWRNVLRETLHVKLGIEASVQDECFEIDPKEEYSEEVMPSKGYANLSSLYMMTTVTVYVIDPDHSALEKIGLPRGNDFVTKEVTKYTTGTLHIWSWAPLGREDTDERMYSGTALEELTQDLYDVESLVQSTASHPQMDTIGLGKPLRRALEKLRHCSAKLYNIDATLAEVDVGSLMGIKRTETLTPDNKVLADFISSNFTRQPAGSRTRRGSAPNLGDPKKAWAGAHDMDEAGPSTRPLSSIDSGSPHLNMIRQGLEDWNLDIFEIDSTTNSRALESYGDVVVLPVCQLSLQCNEADVRTFLKNVGAAYRPNPYHSALHATQVCHSAGWLTSALGIQEEQSNLEAAAFMIACLTHDVCHFGRSSAFCVTTEHSLALLYNNVKVLENMHSAHCFELLRKSNMLTGLSRMDRASLRSQIIEYILATDMAEHFEVISKFRIRREDAAFSISNQADRRFLSRLCIKAGDIGHSALPWYLHARWVANVLEEFYAQGDEEASLGLPVSPLCDRSELADIGKTQKGFLDFVCMPLFAILSEEQQGNAKGGKGGGESGTSRGRSSAAAMRSVRGTALVELEANSQRWGQDAAAVESVKRQLTLADLPVAEGLLEEEVAGEAPEHL